MCSKGVPFEKGRASTCEEREVTLLFEEEGYAGATHGHTKYERAGDQVENHPNVLE